jgi:phenylpropionate dioxygenase-like ring-hydroxylating dioxygenase large terminal subunit
MSVRAVRAPAAWCPSAANPCTDNTGPERATVADILIRESGRRFSDESNDYDDLIRLGLGRIHGSVYTQPSVFEDELDRIWHRGWVYAAHESEVANPGDYVMRLIGREPIVVARSTDGRVHSLLNRCPHRGNRVVNDPCGNSKNFQCAYHAWTFKNTGELLGVPYPQGYPKDFEKSQHGMTSVPRIGIYRGFIFVSLSPEGISFDEHLGDNGKFLIDRMCDVSPTGEIEVKAGALLHRMHCNWKMIFENDTDGYHPQFVHAALFKAQTGERARARRSEDSPLRDVRLKVRDWGHGHAELDTRPMAHAFETPFVSWLPGIDPSKLGHVVAAVEARLGKDKAHQTLVEGPPHATIFPNLFLGQLNVIVLQPLAANDTIQSTSPISLKGAPELDPAILLHTQGGLGPAGLLFGDDDEIAERNQLGLEASSPEWIYLARGMDRQEQDADGVDGSLVSDISDETSQRSFWKRYVEEMRQDGAS